MAMLDGQPEISLKLLNQATGAWVERDYHRRRHAELDATPMAVYLEAPEVGRPVPDSQALSKAFREQVRRKQRRADGTVSLAGQRFEIPNAYRHLEQICLRYAPWDLRTVSLVDERTGRPVPAPSARQARQCRSAPAGPGTDLNHDPNDHRTHPGRHRAAAQTAHARACRHRPAAGLPATPRGTLTWTAECSAPMA